MRVVVWFFAVIGFLTTLAIALVVVAAVHFKSRIHTLQAGTEPRFVTQNTVLTVDVERPITESTPEGLQSLFNDRTTGFTGLLAAIDHAASDPRVKGLIARTGDAQLGLAQAEEFRDAIAAFRAHGKFAFAYAESFGEISGGTRPYYIATAFDQIWLQPAGGLALTGIATEIPFFRGTFDKLGIEPQFERRGAFKTAATEYTDKAMEPSDKEAMTSLVDSLFGQLVDGIAVSRKLDRQTVKSLIDGGPYSADEALSKGLVDHLGYRDEAEDAAKRRAGDGATLMSATNYESVSSGLTSGGSTIGVIRAVGLIGSGQSQQSPLSSSGAVGADTVSEGFDEAIRDDSVKAIVFRIDSPGGSETASETIWRAVKQARQAGKPVIVSMSDEAASGGYYIAAAADKIVAEPLTLTGSIGVFGGKFVSAGLWDKLGVGWDSIAEGQNAQLGSTLTTFTPDQQKRFASLIDVGYRTFLARVADGRHMSVAAVDAIAQGRVWTGAQAHDKGLVDVLGGFAAAAKLAHDAAHLGAGEPIRLKDFPSRESPIAMIAHSLLNGSQSTAESARMLSLLQRLEVLAPVLQKLEATSGSRDATMRPIEVGN
jgi:protease-4